MNDGALDAQHLQLVVREHREVCQKHYVMNLEVPPRVVIDPRPGQFFQVCCDRTAGNKDRSCAPLTLRRPFSAHRIHYQGFDRRLLARASDIDAALRAATPRRVVGFDLLYKVVGEGTERLTRFERGDLLDIIGPLGNGFQVGAERAAVIVGGGVGIAPLVALADRLRYEDKQVYLYLGAFTAEGLRIAVSGRSDLAVQAGVANGTQGVSEVVEAEFLAIGAKGVRVCTDDGSAGTSGFITDLLVADIRDGRAPSENVRFYACGPSGMLTAVAKAAGEAGAHCDVLVEERMACGVGACWSCVCKVKPSAGHAGEFEYRRTCIDGPVFDASRLWWDD
jgi:dihydroorotate dehydrogenase electron transfer subunit